MGGSKYGYAHQQEREAWRPIVAAGQAVCAEPVCKIQQRGGTRAIPAEWAPTQLWHVCHDPSGTLVIGVGHRACNLSEAARRGNRMRRRRAKPRRKPQTEEQTSIWWRP